MIALYGDPGTGKSAWARAHFGATAYFKDSDDWWCGYDGHQQVIMDDIDCGSLPANVLKYLFDRFPLQVECKCGFHQFNAKTIVVTSNSAREEWYKWDSLRDKDLLPGILARIEYIVKFSRDGIEVVKEPLQKPFASVCPSDCQFCKQYWKEAGATKVIPPRSK